MSSFARNISLNLLLFVLLSTFSGISNRSIAQSPSGPPEYLFIVDISKSAKEYRQNQILELKTQIATGLNGAMSDGDTFTIWTAGKSVKKRSFPITRWSNSRANMLAAKAVELLVESSWSEKAEWRSSLGHFYSAIKGAKDINLIIISPPVHFEWGSPFDSRIKSYLEQKSKKHIVFKKPLVTAIKSQGAQIVDLSLSANNEMIPLFESQSDQNTANISSYARSQPNENNNIFSKFSQNLQPSRVSSKPFIMVGDEILSEPGQDLTGTQDDIAQSSISGSKYSQPIVNKIPEPEVEKPEFTTPRLNAKQIDGVPNPKENKSVSTQIAVKHEIKPLNPNEGVLVSNDPEETESTIDSSNPEKEDTQLSGLKIADNIVEVQAKEINSAGTQKAPPVAMAAPAKEISFTTKNLYLILGIASVIVSVAFFVLAIKFKPAGPSSLITEAFNLKRKKRYK